MPSFTGDAGGNVLTGTNDADYIDGNGGDDTISGAGGDDNLDGGEGSDTVRGGDGDDSLFGDETYGAASDLDRDTLYGDAGADILRDGAGNDRLYGGADNDFIGSNHGSDALYGEGGDDRLWAGSGGGINTLSGGVGNDQLYMTGGSGTMSGGIGNDLLECRSGTCTLNGGDGDDTLVLGGGIWSNDGIQTAIGGAGADIFSLWALSTDDGWDRILDFNQAEGDLLRLPIGWNPWPVDAPRLFSGYLDPSSFVLGAALPGQQLIGQSSTGGFVQFWYTQKQGNTYVVADLNTNLTYDAGDLVVELSGLHTLSSASFSPGNFYTRVGTSGAETVTGGEETDYLFGLAGDDVLNGFGEWDWLEGGDGNDTIDGGVGRDVLHGGAGDDRMFGGDGEDQLMGGAGADILEGGAGGDHLSGGDGDNVLRGGDGSDGLFGGSGRDTLDGGAWHDTLDGFTGDDLLLGSEGGDSYWGGEGNDTVDFSPLSERVTVDLALFGYQNLGAAGYGSVAHVENLRGTAGDDSFFGNAGVNVLAGAGGSDVLDGRDGDDVLDGGLGADAMTGGLGNDIFRVDDSGDSAVEAAGAGYDRVEASVNYSLGANIEELVLTGTAGLTGVGNEGANLIVGNVGKNRLEGLGGNDTLNGGLGADTMVGGTGNDTYVIDNAGDVVIESLNAGSDTIESSISWTLGANVEHLTLTGTAAINATGDGGFNILRGNDGANRLDGGAGADRMHGGDGDDRYIVDDAGDRVYEGSATGGYDAVFSSIGFSLAYQQLERLELTGSADIDATGNSLDNVLVGNSGANTLDGGIGVDVMGGRGGDDTYIVDQVGESVIESAGGGTDTVLSYATFHLSRAYEIENLTLIGSSAVNAYGNHLDNRLGGNDNNNLLNGSAGADTMIGKGGTDTYYVDNVGDVVIEEAGGGVDTVRSLVSYTLGDHVENLGLEGSADIDATGNALDNRISGNHGANRLDGGAGADVMNGYRGDDIYIVDNAGDMVQEFDPAGGTDIVLASVSYRLGGTQVETLQLTGNAAIDGTGHNAANTVIGNGAANRLYGKLGNDVLEGGGGSDGFMFDTRLSAATNVDTILDFSVADDTIHLSRGVFGGIKSNGTLAQSAFRAGTAAQDADDRIVYDSATGRIFYDADGNGAGAAMLFAIVDVGTPLTHLDFSAYTPV